MKRTLRCPSLPLLVPSAFVLLALAACDSSPSGSAPKASVAVASQGGLSVELLTDTRLETGMTPVYLRVSDTSGRSVTDATVTFAPTMAMATGTSHGAPVIAPPALDADGLYRCDVVFQMASGASGSWSATVGITRPGATEVAVPFPALTVSDGGRARTFTYTDPNTSATVKYVASLNFKEKPRVGLNPVVVTLHRMQDMMTFPPVTDAAMSLDPQMPSMSHGSPGSVDPTPTTLGRYEGQLSFSMPGDWETTVAIRQGGLTLGAPKFTTTF